MLEPNIVLNGRYRLLAPLGEGGMARVFRGLDTRLGRNVAIKLLHEQLSNDEPFLQRFQQEAEFAASLGDHPNIVDIYDIGQDGSLHYIVMELLEGRSLKELIQERAPFSVAEAFAIGRQIAGALDHAHKRGLVHRDVKPQNVLVSPDGVAKVTDFGIARSITASQLTREGMVMGTVHYFSPEQARGERATPASDIYSLGIILYEMLTKHLPFEAETAIGVAMQHLHSQPPPPWEYNPELPTRAAVIVLRALEKDPRDRYRDAAEFGSALAGVALSAPGMAPTDPGATTMNAIVPPVRQETATYQPVRAARPPPIERTKTIPAAIEPRESRRALWLVAGGLALALIVGLGAFLLTNQVLGSSATPTPTATNTPRPTATPHRIPTSTATVPVVVQATETPTFAPPTFTPKPTNTPFVPTATPTPLPTATPTQAGQTPTPTPAGSTPTATPSGPVG